MDMEYSAIRYSDKPYTTYGTSGPRARDGIRMAEIVHGGREAIEAERRAHGHREPELAADLGLPHDRRADGRGPRRTSRSS